MKKKVCICWSGGIDSTAVLKQYLEKTDYEVVAIHVTYKHGTIAKRDIRENNAIKSLLPILQEIRAFEIRYITIDIESRITSLDIPMLGLHIYAVAYKEGCLDIILGYVNDKKNQDAHIKRLNDGLNAIGAIFYHLNRYENPPPIFRKPIDNIFGSKGHYIEQLGQLIQYTWFCRSPQKVKDGEIGCGECHACRHVKRSIGLDEPINA